LVKFLSFIFFIFIIICLTLSIVIFIVYRCLKWHIPKNSLLDKYILLTMTNLKPDFLSANEKYAETFKDGDLLASPSKKIAVLSCMDARISINDILGLKLGDAHVIRNAGGIATDDAIRSLIISHELLGTEEFIVINHTDCGMLKFKDEELQKKISEKFNINASSLKFYCFPNLEENVREQIKKIKLSPFFPNVPIHGYIYNVKTGKLNNVV
jgi:carbonic anhydrase